MLNLPTARLWRKPWLGFKRLLLCSSLERQLRASPVVRAFQPEVGSLLYIAASALPYHISGYTARTHEIVRALHDAGARVFVHTRPGYPWDRKDRLSDAVAGETTVDGVRYRHAVEPANDRPLFQYVQQAASVIAAEAQQRRVSIIHAASNHVNALPALLAARRLGLPFHYEMRGLWELTRVSRQPEFEGSQAYQLGLALEALVARHADRVFVISDQLGHYVAENWKLPADRLSLLPNCVMPERFSVAQPGEIEWRSIAYAGSLIGYEGLDTLIEAVARLKENGSRVRVRIVGDGEARSGLERLAAQLGVEDCVQFMGRLLPEVAREVVRCCALVCLPRKPFQVCRIVTPIKLIEALAMGKPVIVPDLPVFRDELGGDPTGWFFRAGDAADLARTINAVFSDQPALAAMGLRAREYAVLERNWHRYVTPIVEAAYMR